MLPDNVLKIDVGATEGKTGWSEYQRAGTFHGYNVGHIYQVVKVGLADG